MQLLRRRRTVPSSDVGLPRPLSLPDQAREVISASTHKVIQCEALEYIRARRLVGTEHTPQSQRCLPGPIPFHTRLCLALAPRSRISTLRHYSILTTTSSPAISFSLPPSHFANNRQHHRQHLSHSSHRDPRHDIDLHSANRPASPKCTDGSTGLDSTLPLDLRYHSVEPTGRDNDLLHEPDCERFFIPDADHTAACLDACVGFRCSRQQGTRCIRRTLHRTTIKHLRGRRNRLATIPTTRHGSTCSRQHHHRKDTHDARPGIRLTRTQQHTQRLEGLAHRNTLRNPNTPPPDTMLLRSRHRNAEPTM